MFLYKAFILIATLGVDVLSLPLATDPTRNVTYQGVTKNEVEHFLNIRFGENTGSRRFAHPKPFYYNNGTVVSATMDGPACPQSTASIGSPNGPATISEDCLNLRIARSANTDMREKLPVMVWIHGGKLTMTQELA